MAANMSICEPGRQRSLPQPAVRLALASIVSGGSRLLAAVPETALQAAVRKRLQVRQPGLRQPQEPGEAPHQAKLPSPPDLGKAIHPRHSRNLPERPEPN